MPNMTAIKICGIRDVATAVVTANIGADFIGLLFHSDSKRSVTREKAKEIVSAVKLYKVKVVGVFVEQKAEEIRQICNYVGISTVQLHGDNAKAAAVNLPLDFEKIFVVNVDYDGSIAKSYLEKLSSLNVEQDYLLFDGLNPGSGKPFRWCNFTPDREFRFFLSGGLSHENVCEAISSTNPFGVDVSSSVEREKGIKEIELIKEFIGKVNGR